MSKFFKNGSDGMREIFTPFGGLLFEAGQELEVTDKRMWPELLTQGFLEVKGKRSEPEVVVDEAGKVKNSKGVGIE